MSPKDAVSNFKALLAAVAVCLLASDLLQPAPAQGQTCAPSPDLLGCLGDCSVPGEFCHPREIRADANGNFLEVTCCSCDPEGCTLQVDPATLEYSCTPNPGCPVPPGGECRLIGHGNLDGTITFSCECVDPEAPHECFYVEECNANCPGTCVKRCTGVCPDPSEACVPNVLAETFPGARDFRAVSCACDHPGSNACRPVATPDGVDCVGVCPDGVSKCELVVAIGADGLSQEYSCEPCNTTGLLGACCTVDDMGSIGCIETTLEDCSASPANTFLGVGTTCAAHGVQCEQLHPEYGACCYVDPPSGQSVCSIVTQAECLSVLNGIFQGANTTCTPDPCPPPPFHGACCYIDGAGNPQCTETDPATCELEYQGVYQGDGVDCDSNACPIEESCQCPGNCEDRTPAFEDPAYAAFTDEVAVATENSQLLSDPVVVLIDIKNRNLAPLNLNWTPRTNSRYSHPTWTLANLGSVFGLALDVRGHIYVSASTCYAVDTLGSVPGATWGSVYRLDATTGAISVFANLPNTGPALGNVCYHGPQDQFFVSNLEDGRIYRLDSTGACLGTFDHATGNISASCAAEGGDAPGFVPPGERVWGLQVYNGRLYYGVWSEDFSNATIAFTNTIWSIALTGGNFSGAPVLEIALPPLPGSYFAPLSMPPADIAFSQTGCMLVAERGMSSDTWPSPHSSRVLEYRQTISGAWVPSSFTFDIGVINNGTNSAGGVDYDRAGNVWATGDALQFWPLTVYGLQSLPCAGGDVTNSVLVDLNGVYSTWDKTEIGDVEIGCSEKCLPPPWAMVAWYPLDENSVAAKAEDIVWDRDGVFSGTTSVSGMVSAARRFNGSSDFIRVPSAVQHNFGVGDFSIDLWVRSTASTGLQVMLDRRDTTGGSRGFSLFLGNGTLGFQLGDGFGFTNYPRAGFFADGLWHHVAVTVDRDQPNGLVMYVDGVGVPKDPTPHAQSISSAADLYIGSRAPSFGQIFFAGDLDEIELFNRALTPAEVQALYSAGKQGKCKDRCHLPWDAQLCRNRNTITVNLTICNDSPVAHNYVYSLAGNNNCTWPSPTVFSPSAGSVTVGANACVNIPVTITRPAGMTSGFVACYNAYITNLDNGHQFGCEGSIWARNFWCIHVYDGELDPTPIGVGVGVPTTLVLQVENDGDPVGDFPYQLVAMPSDMAPDLPNPVSINGLPPGEPYLGNLFVAPGTAGELPVVVSFANHEPFRFFDLLLTTDAGGPPGAQVPAASIALRSVLPCGDLNGDGVIDAGDAHLFDQCLAGPGQAPDVTCPVTVDADCDDDDDVDLRDFSLLQDITGTVIYMP